VIGGCCLYPLSSQILTPVRQDLMAYMEGTGKRYGFRLWDEDDPEVVWALPELTQWYLTSHEIRPVGTWFCSGGWLQLLEGMR
jgi:hypothetical protein